VSRRALYSPSKAAKAALGTNGFVAHTAELLQSKAWRSRSIHLVRLLDRLELENIAHAGKENGYLRVTWGQLVEYGLGRRFISAAIHEGVQLGLLQITHQGRYRAGKTDPSLYRLTYLASKFMPLTGPPEYHPPTDDWRDRENGRTKPARPQKHRSFGHPWEPTEFTMGDLFLRADSNDSATHKEVRMVTRGELLYTLRSTSGVPAEDAISVEPVRRLRTAPRVAVPPKAGGSVVRAETPRERERRRYLEVNGSVYGLDAASERWRQYEALILAQYHGKDIEAAWRARDRAY